MRSTPYLVVLLAALAACTSPNAPGPTDGQESPRAQCGDVNSFGFEVHVHEEGPEEVFMFTRGQRWLFVDADCGLEVWEGHGPEDEETRPLARQDLTEEKYYELRSRLGVDAWDAHEEDEFESDTGNYRGGTKLFLSGERTTSCTYCAAWVDDTLTDILILLEELYIGSAPVGDDYPLQVGTVRDTSPRDASFEWSTEWKLDVPPGEFAITDWDIGGGAVEGDDERWLRSVRADFRATHTRSQHWTWVVHEGAYYSLWLREW